ncbi:cellulose biosynthesis protein BcsR [Mixta sp. Marseille-Q2659]|uniref:cellulose biosynthesis protein BcsR n=1 Tax=Mixta sp. Marseille-Q2659 TaxID=2736607 RepID=UPI0023B8BF22|nr:cellulose biosynthesis protein BcsR [Mixta sp. Marseille-Q2659]
MSGSAFAVTHHAFSSGAGRTSDGNGSHASTLKSPSYTKSVSWQHYQLAEAFSFSAFRYVDIAREERLAAILARWPLLNELSVEQKEKACRS